MSLTRQQLFTLLPPCLLGCLRHGLLLQFSHQFDLSCLSSYFCSMVKYKIWNHRPYWIQSFDEKLTHRYPLYPPKWPPEKMSGVSAASYSFYIHGASTKNGLDGSEKLRKGHRPCSICNMSNGYIMLWTTEKLPLLTRFLLRWRLVLTPQNSLLIFQIVENSFVIKLYCGWGGNTFKWMQEPMSDTTSNK